MNWKDTYKSRKEPLKSNQKTLNSDSYYNTSINKIEKHPYINNQDITIPDETAGENSNEEKIYWNKLDKNECKIENADSIDTSQINYTDVKAEENSFVASKDEDGEMDSLFDPIKDLFGVYLIRLKMKRNSRKTKYM